MLRLSPFAAMVGRRLLLAAAIASIGFLVAPRHGLVAPPSDASISRAVTPTPAPRPSHAGDPAALRRAHLPGPYPVEVLRVLDGDTIEGRVRVWFGQEITTLVRLRGIDAPELKARCGEELRGAEAARDTLAGLLASGGASIDDVALDKYGGRVVASLFVDRGGDQAPLDVARAMIEAGMARAYGGGKREAWCPLPRVARG
jgi:endonuclease YncB( thermonuclease family)